VQHACNCTGRGKNITPLSQQSAYIAHEVRRILFDLKERGVRRVTRSAPAAKAHQRWLRHSFCCALRLKVCGNAPAKLLLLISGLCVQRCSNGGVKNAVQLSHLALLGSTQPSCERCGEHGRVARYAQNLSVAMSN
jgi:hypothetical protein